MRVRVSAYDSDDVFRVICVPPYDEVVLFLLQKYGDISTYAVTITFWIRPTLRTGCDVDGSVGRSAVQHLTSRRSIAAVDPSAVHLHKPVGQLPRGLRLPGTCSTILRATAQSPEAAYFREVGE